MSDNISEFNAQVMRAIAALYKAHPAPIELDHEITLKPKPDTNDPEYQQRMESARGTILWLYRNGIVTGDLQEGSAYAGIFDAQLTAYTLGILSRQEQNANNQTLGQIVISGATAEPGTREETVASELVGRRLLGG